MERLIKTCYNCDYEKVSGDNNPCMDCDRDYGNWMEKQPVKLRGFEPVREEFQTNPDDITVLPVRGTKTSAGIDFITTEDVVIRPQETASFKTDIKAYMQADEMLLMLPRSSVGFKNNLMLVNTVGLIDSDFYENPENDGNIGVGLFNFKPTMRMYGFTKIKDMKGNEHTIPLIEDLTEANTVILPKGLKIVQAVFAKYLEADNCETDNVRTGGIGSSGK